MSYDKVSGRWKCTDFTWKGRFKHKAKANSRDCGLRRKVRKSRKGMDFSCSSDGCDNVFSLRSKLNKHYRGGSRNFLWGGDNLKKLEKMTSAAVGRAEN